MKTQKKAKRHVTGISISFIDGNYEVEITRDKLRKRGGIFMNTKLVCRKYTVKTSNDYLLGLFFKLVNCSSHEDLWFTSFFNSYPSTDIHTTVFYDKKRMERSK
jgi:hypothetical protein